MSWFLSPSGAFRHAATGTADMSSASAISAIALGAIVADQ
jgi:hypothetical protein